MLDDDRSEDSTPKAGKKSKTTQHTFVLDLPFKKLLRENESQSPEPRARKISDQSDEMKKCPARFMCWEAPGGQAAG